VHEFAGPPGAATVVLLHGLGGTAAGNWSTAMPALARDFRVVAPDLRGHDSGSVDDVIAMADALGIDAFIAVGYSMGSAVAARLGRRYPDRVEGLVLCAAAGVSALPGDISDVATAVVVTRQDRLIPAWRQLELARSIPGATVHTVDGNHFAFARADVFIPTLLQACHSVIQRAGERHISL
jgi:alpha-beta hydrolase superfamily lysophospholipase